MISKLGVGVNVKYKVNKPKEETKEETKEEPKPKEKK